MTTDKLMAMTPAFANLLLTIADDKLILGHRNSDWTGLAPILEEDIAFSALAQDDISHAAALYELIAAEQDTNADQIAFGRSPDEYRCAEIVEIHDDFDWAAALVRQLFCSHFDAQRYERLRGSTHPEVAALAGRLAAEQVAHTAHVDAWIRRLGRGNDDARGRLQAALDTLTPLACMLFEQVEGDDALAESGAYPADEHAFDQWAASISRVTDDAGLHVSLTAPDPSLCGGRRGVHSTQLKDLLDEMCEVFRLEPDAAW